MVNKKVIDKIDALWILGVAQNYFSGKEVSLNDVFRNKECIYYLDCYFKKHSVRAWYLLVELDGINNGWICDEVDDLVRVDLLITDVKA